MGFAEIASGVTDFLLSGPKNHLFCFLSIDGHMIGFRPIYTSASTVCCIS